MANALTKAKSLVSNYLKEADQLTNEQRSSFESEINQATTAEQLENIQKAIELTNLKEKTKKEINKLELISKQQKDQLNQSVDQQQNDQGIKQILDSVNELNKQKESVKEAINQLNNASDQLVKKYNDQLVEADSSEKVQKLLADLKDLDTYKVEKKNEIDGLNSLSETDKQNLYEELKSAETKEAVDNVVQKAKNLDQSKKDGLSTLASLSDLSEDDQKRFRSLINKSTTSEEANKALENAKALNEAKKSAKASLEALTNLSTQHKEELKQNIINSVSIEAVSKIKEEAIKLENEKKSLIEEVNKLEHFESTQKEQFVKQIKDKKNIQEANELTSTLKEVEKTKKEVKLLINDSNSKVSGQDKQSLNEELTKATTKEEVAKVKEKLELAKKKLDAVQAINDLTDANQDKKNEFIKQIEQAEDSDEVESILATARNDFVSASKFKAKSEIHKLNYLSQKEQDEFIKTLDDLTLENKQSFDDKLRELTEKNKEKEDLYKSLESKKDLFSPALQQKIKEQLINEDQKDKYTLLADKYDALAKTKEQIKQKIEGLESTGDKNKQDLIAKLTEKEDEPSAKALETEAVELDNLKKELMSSVDTLKNIEDNERQSIKTQIKDAPTKDQAQKLHDNLKLKSQKEQAKNDVAGLSDIDSKKENYKNQIDLAENDEEIQRILNRAKNESQLNKAKSNAKTQIEKLTLISPEHKQRLLNEIASKNDSNEVNKTLTLANELEEFKKENSFQKLNLTEIAKEQNANTKYNELILNKTTKSEVQNLANEYKSRESEIVKANQAIDKLTNMSQTVRTALKEKVKSAQKDQINNIVNEAKQLDAQNAKNITDLNKLQLLNQQYRTNKTDEIKNQTTIATSNSILKEAQELNKTKQAAKNEIDSNNLLSTKQQSDLNNRLLEANGNTAINAIKQENNKIKAYKQQASTKVNNNKDYLTRSEIDNVTGAIKNANDENGTNRKAEESKTLNDAKKKYAQQINGLDLLTSQTKSEAVSYIKTNNGQDPAKQKYDQLKQKNDSKNSHLQLIKSTSEITAAGKRSLEQELRSSDNDQVINNIPQKVNSWKEESLKNSKITTASKTSLTKMKELATNNTQMWQDLENLQNLIKSNTKQDSDSLENLKTKNQNLNNQINSHITKFNKNVNSLIDEAKTKAEKPDNLESKEELTKIKEKLEADISKYNEIKQSISEAFGREIDKNGYDNAIAKYEQTKSWIEQKIELATKYSNLKGNVQGSSLSQKDKEKYENNIKNNVKNKDLGTSDFSALETKINEAIKNREDIVNKYTLAKNELKKYVDKLSDTSAITKYTQLNSSHQSISQNYNVLLERVSDKFNSDMGDDEIKNLTHEFTEYYETLSYYDVVFQSVKNYISTRSSNDETTDKGWTKYYTLMKPVIDRLATKGSTKNLEFIVGQKALLANAEDEVKKEIFKFEVLRLIGSGKWSKGGNSGTIAFAYFDKDSKKPVLNKEHYSSKFPNFRVEFLTSGIEEDWTRSRYSWTGRVKFHSGDNNDIVLSLKDEHKFLAIPVKTRYDQKTDKKTAHSTNPDRGRWFNENDFANN
ncbi:hypothetical protein [Ureaplasma diversum]|uniref:hypothetical protein n=1 Tax=Ureaplasma diversum TaxID=42094 RepID=UPI002457BDFC|nr:hypothetical protein [Ureaplasma diversum]